MVEYQLKNFIKEQFKVIKNTEVQENEENKIYKYNNKGFLSFI